MTDLWMVFDVESIGLHGEGFAVAYVVVNRAGETLAQALYSCHPLLARGRDENREWVAQNIPKLPMTHDDVRGVRQAFWVDWRVWQAKGAVLVADCAWPVEARFLAACVDDYPVVREWQGPYPLHDLASVLLARGLDPLAVTERLPNELPAHNPEKTIWSHARWMSAGKGRSLKAHDLCGAYCCTDCDAVYDGQARLPDGVTREQVDLDWMHGHLRSLVRLAEKGMLK